MTILNFLREIVCGMEKISYLCTQKHYNTRRMATTTARRRTTRPMSYYWGVVKDMDDSQKLELVTMLIESVKPKMTAEPPMKRYTMDDINAMIDEAEREIAAGLGTPHEEVMREWDEELAREEQEELEMAEMV